MQERTLAVGDMKLAILEAGVGGRPLLLVHGFTGAKEDFGDQIDLLADAGWWVVAPDQRGHGASTMLDDEAAYSLEIFAADIDGLIAELGWDRLVLLGHSMGGMIAQVVAAARPDRLDGLILMDTSHGPLPGIDLDLVALGVQVVRDGGLEAIKAVLDAMGGDAPLGSAAHERVCATRPGYQEFSDRKFLTSSPAMYASMLSQLVTQTDRLESLAALPIPTLVLVGAEDVGFIKASHAMADTIPNAALVTIPDAGHSPQFENGPAWNAAMLSFLGER